MTPYGVTSLFLSRCVKTRQFVEAGGIEPPSRGISAEASTCVVGLLFCWTPETPTNRIPEGPGPGLMGFASAPPDGRLRLACYGRLSKPRRPGKADAQLIKLRVRSAYRHLLFLPGVLRGRLTTSARDLNVNLPGRVHSPPGKLC